MGNPALPSLIIVIVLAVSFDIVNGFHDSANAIATSISTRVLSPRVAILMAAVCNFFGALISHNVAGTISQGLVHGNVEQYVIISALIGAIAWNLITWRLGLPSSSSHALIGALLGSVLMDTLSAGDVIWSGLLAKVVLPLVLSPVAGFIVAFLFMKLLLWLLASVSRLVVNRWFSKLQIISAAFMALSHGMNDAQKSMGIITLALISGGFLVPPQSGQAAVPVWVILLCAAAMAIGTSMGGSRIIKTVGMKMIKLTTVDGFAAEASAGAVITVMSALGNPLSTTHVITSAIMGVGSAKRFSSVRWSVVRSMVLAWVVTLPISALLGAAMVLLVKAVIRIS
ncbi:MAG: inorganic phosphate transporter [Firmicutes bacterium]|nr:inorganic phosphate transporter [Bacillota bacterium]